MKLFTIREANLLIPEVRDILAELRFTKNQITERSQEIELNLSAPKTNNSIVKNSTNNAQAKSASDKISIKNALDLVQSDPEIKSLSIYFEQLLGKYRTRGIICRSVEQGLFDFPALGQDRYLYFCWLSTEDRIEWWHDIEAGFSARKLLVDAPLSDESGLKVAH